MLAVRQEFYSSNKHWYSFFRIKKNFHFIGGKIRCYLKEIKFNFTDIPVI